MSTTIRAKAALAEIHALGRTIDDVLAVDAMTDAQTQGPTFAEYLPAVESGYPARSRRGIKAVERLAGKAVAAAFAGHEPEGVTGGYTVADITEVAAAVAILTGEPHPLDPSQGDETGEHSLRWAS